MNILCGLYLAASSSLRGPLIRDLGPIVLPTASSSFSSVNEESSENSEAAGEIYCGKYNKTLRSDRSSAANRQRCGLP